MTGFRVVLVSALVALAVSSPAAARRRQPSPKSAVCGNGRVEPGETCDDGNTKDGDVCPSKCRIEVCQPTSTRFDVSVSVALPADVPVGGVVVLLDYPEGRVSLPGSGHEQTVRARFTNTPAGFMTATYDLDYAVREVVAMNKTLRSGELYRASFDLCAGATPPQAADFACRVEQASGPGGNNLPPAGITCAVKLP